MEYTKTTVSIQKTRYSAMFATSMSNTDERRQRRRTLAPRCVSVVDTTERSTDAPDTMKKIKSDRLRFARARARSPGDREEKLFVRRSAGIQDDKSIASFA